MKHLTLVAGARPNFMKIAPIVREIRQHASDLRYSLVHTGQHYDREMSDVFFSDLGIPNPDFQLDIVSTTPAVQTANIMIEFEKILTQIETDSVVVVGDVNSTIACALVAKTRNLHVSHVEAGLRSGDRTMPEEINRVLTDAISDEYFVTEPAGVENLTAAGADPVHIHFVGHVMVDNLLYQLDKTKDFRFPNLDCLNTDLSKPYSVLTIHRPSNVDSHSALLEIFAGVEQIAALAPVVFPAHPRTLKNLTKYGIKVPKNVEMVAPFGYSEFLNLWKNAKFVVTDSGGLQEETTALGVPCITLRENTERPITVEQGTNVLVGRNVNLLVGAATRILDGEASQSNVPPFWDGKASKRIIEILIDKLS